VVLVVLAGVALLMAVDAFVGELVFTQRQHQRAADFRTPRNFTARGRAIAILQVPSLGLNLVVNEGTTASVLRGGPGHLPNSAVPGAAGNTVVLGHARHFGGPFGAIHKLKAGDAIWVQPKGSTDVVQYTVMDVTRGGPGAIDLLAPTDDTRLTIVTSASGLLTGDRVVVSATASAPVKRPPAALSPPRAPDSFEPDSSLVSGNLLLSAAWLAIGIAVVGAFRYRYPGWVLAVAGGLPLLLGLAFLWFEIDRWLPSTL
jgi:LPXTG-site transpeptidase (sortase) family protein